MKTICRPLNRKVNRQNLSRPSSKLECTSKARFCRAEHLLLDLRHLHAIPQPMKYRTDVLNDGQVGGFNCQLDQQLLNQLDGHKSPLQSWYEEIEHFRSLNESQHVCDVHVSTTTYIVKLDATVNMYHHFCDFINLYSTMHLNEELVIGGERQLQMLLWDMQEYRSVFAPTWSAITRRPLWTLNKFAGKRVCFQRVVFPLLPRMIFGLYYNMPLQPGCQRSGLVHAFNRHVLHRLGIRQELPIHRIFKPEPEDDLHLPVRITFISRSTAHRRVLNEQELTISLQQNFPNIRVRLVDFHHGMPFEHQLQISANTDVLIGMHGAGLTHLLFLPDWAVVFELFNCDDRNCYLDLARLRGIRYLTWEDRKKLIAESRDDKQNAGPNKTPAHLKFTNYRFDVQEFVRLSAQAIDYVKKLRPKFVLHSRSHNDSMLSQWISESREKQRDEL